MDLFEQWETLPKRVIEVLSNVDWLETSYENCAKLVTELEAIGYTCDYGLDASPYDLKKIKIS